MIRASFRSGTTSLQSIRSTEIAVRAFSDALPMLTGNVTIHWVSPKMIAKLNWKFRKNRRPATVLSFPLLEFQQWSEIFPAIKKVMRLSTPKKRKGARVLIPDSNKKNLEFGEIFLCSSLIRKQAKNENQQYPVYLQRLVVHSLLHLIGWSHQNKKNHRLMEQWEDRILNNR